MIVIVASHHDEAARALAARWKTWDAALLTCQDLSVNGWRYYLSNPKASIAVIGGREVAQKEINGVLIRLPGVLEQELLHIVPSDRGYVAEEMTSFLLAWLFTLPCPILNRPTPSSLSGPSWRGEQWVYAAAQVGIPVRPIQRHIAFGRDRLPEVQEPNSIMVTVVGDRCFGTADKALAVQARHLADVAKVDLLAVQFSNPESGSFFVGADLWPDIVTDQVADAVLEYLQRDHAGGSLLVRREDP